MRVDDETRAPLLPVVKEHYTQRAQTPGTLLIAEGTMVAAKAGGYPNLPEIWSAEQIAAWKEVTNLKLTKLISDFIPFKVVDAVHAQGNYIILQLAGPPCLCFWPAKTHLLMSLVCQGCGLCRSA